MISTSGITDAFLFEWRRLMKFPRIAWWIALAGFPPVIVGLILSGTNNSSYPNDLALISVASILTAVTCVLGLLLVATPVIYAELEGKTWSYLAVRPDGKISVLLGKYLAAASWSATTGWLALLGCFTLIELGSNRIPEPSFTIDPPGGQPPLEVVVDASSSNDPDGDIAHYTWEFGDGSIGMERILGHTFHKSGEYVVRLTVEDNDGATARTSQILVVGGGAPNGRPRAAFTMDRSAGESPFQILFDASSSSDSDGEITSYTWNFGDGRGGSSSSPIVEHSFTYPGEHTVTLVVEDDDGVTAQVARDFLLLGDLRVTRLWGSLFLFVPLMTLAIGAAMIFLGVLCLRKAMVFGVLYALFFEAMIGWIPAVVSHLTVNYHLRTLWFKAAGVPRSPELDLIVGQRDAILYVGSILLYAAIFLAGALYVLRRRQLVTQQED